MKNILPLLSLILVLTACEHKDYADPIPGNPAFSVSGLRNGQPFSIAAGENGLIQSADVERNKYGVIEWTSKLTAAECETCQPELLLTVNDVEGITFENSVNSEILNPGELAFANAPSDSGFTTCRFDLLFSGADDDLEDIDFHVNGGPQVNVFPVTLDPGINIIDADFSLEDNSANPEYTVTQTIMAGSHHKLSAPLRFRYSESNDDEHLHLYFPQQQIGGLRAVSWEWGNSTESATSQLSELIIPLDNVTFIRLNFHNDEVNLNGYYEISWNVEPELLESEDNDNSGIIRIAPAIQTTWETGELNYGKVFLDYTYNGKHYTSVNPTQTAVMTITANEPYEIDDGSGLNRQIEVNFSVTLYEVGNPQNTLELSNCSGTFGFTLPE